MSKEVAKSAEVLEKEALIKDLQSQLKKRKRTLKGLKTRLENTKNDITDIQRSGSGEVISRMSQIEKLRVELVDLVKQMTKMKGLSRMDKAALKDMERGFASEDMFGEQFKSFKEQMGEMEDFDFEGQFGENERAKMRDIFATFAVKPTKEEQKDIRKVFISLSQKFHPDKARTKADEEEYHQMMQKINKAYQAGDIQTLLELERLFLTENLDLTKVQSLSVDVLEQEIERLNRDLQFIENQIDRNSAELKNLRASDLGQMLTDMKKAEKEGMGMDTALAQLDDSIEHLTKMRDAFAESIKVGHIGPINELMMAEQTNQPSQQEMLDMLSDMMNGKVDPSDLADMFGAGTEDNDDDLFDMFGLDEEEEVEGAKFQIGDSVKIAKGVEEDGINVGGLQGRIQDIYYDFNDEIICEVELDSLSLKKLPADFIMEMVEEEEDFQNFEIEENQLKKARPRDSEEDTIGAYRKLLHKNMWQDVLPSIQKRLRTILLLKPALPDHENWFIYLDRHLRFPINAKCRGLIDFRKGDKMKVTGIAGFNAEAGIIVNVVYKGRIGDYPLFDLLADNKKTSVKEIFSDYFLWAEEMHEIYEF